MIGVTLRHEVYKDDEGLKLISETNYDDASRVAVYFDGRHVGSLAELVEKAETLRKMMEFIRREKEQAA